MSVQSPRGYLALYVLLGALAVILWAWLAGWPGPIVESDIEQVRLDQALPLLRGAVQLRQTFTPRHDGLTEVEVQAARYEVEENDGALNLRLYDEQGELVAERTLDTRSLTHNQFVTLTFPPQPASGGQRYALEVEGQGSGAFSLWGYTLDVLQPGALSVSGAESAARTLRFVTRYELTPAAALRELWSAVQEGAAVIFLSLTLI
ncbi:MAG: hypothetical protein ACRDIB_09285, partial [Ardenticatenaceae bacterium]